MTSTSPCLHLVLARPSDVPSSRWVDAWQVACRQRAVPDLVTFSIGHDRCELSVRTRHGQADRGLWASLDAVADGYRVAKITPAPRPEALALA